MIDTLGTLWADVTGERLDPDAVRIIGDEQVLPGPFRVTAAASACVAATTLAAKALRGSASGPVEVEDAVVAAGGAAAAMRSRADWLAHPQGVAVRAEPLVALDRIGDAPPRPLPPGERALSGVQGRRR